MAIWLIAILALSLWPGLEAWAIHSTVESLRLALLVLGHHSAVSDDVVSLGAAQFQIVSDCTPLMPTALLWSGCLAFPAPWRWKAAGLATGGAALWMYNVIRLVVLFLVKARWPRAFDFIHMYVWQSATLLVVFLLFLVWIGARNKWERLRQVTRVQTPATDRSVSTAGS